MSKLLYIDCGYGIAGDMLLSSLCDLGVDPQYIIDELKKTVNFDFELKMRKVNQQGITASKLSLSFGDEFAPVKSNKHEEHSHAHNHYATIRTMINNSGLNKHTKELSLSVFETIGKAESKIHGVPLEDVAFHEVGATDSIVDIVGNCIAIDKLGVDKIISAPVPTGHGKVKVQHGLYPIAAPATLEILRDVPLSGFSAEGELTTPTGAAIVKTLSDSFSTDVKGIVREIGYGSGTRKFNHPNVLRVMIVEDFDNTEKKKTE